MGKDYDRLSKKGTIQKSCGEEETRNDNLNKKCNENKRVWTLDPGYHT